VAPLIVEIVIRDGCTSPHRMKQQRLPAKIEKDALLTFQDTFGTDSVFKKVGPSLFCSSKSKERRLKRKRLRRKAKIYQKVGPSLFCSSKSKERRLKRKRLRRKAKIYTEASERLNDGDEYEACRPVATKCKAKGRDFTTVLSARMFPTMTPAAPHVLRTLSASSTKSSRLNALLIVPRKSI
jgi:hypothetical protein